MKRRLTFDFETRSSLDLPKVGAHKYSLHPSTQPTCLAVKIHGDPEIAFLDFHQVNLLWEDHPPEFRNWWKHLIRERYEFSGHNVFFDRSILENILVRRLGWPEIDPGRYRCTAAKAAACALPRSLANAGEAMKLAVQKDFRGYQAMMRTCKPSREWRDWHKMTLEIGVRSAAGKKLTPKQKKFIEAARPCPPEFISPEMEPRTWATLYEYCKIDVLAEEALDDALPDLIPEEQEIWHLNQTLNWRGLRIDIPTVKKVVAIMETESTRKLKELDRLTMGLVTKPGSRKKIMEFLALEGVELPNLQKQTVQDKLQGFDLSTDMKRLLQIRQALSLASTKKYQSFLERAGADDRVRDLTMYHGASTGRDTGTGIQIHNFPKGLLAVDKARPYAAVENVVECDPEMLRLLYGESLPVVFSAILRNMIIPTDGYEFFVADFSKIEVAVCWWFAGNKPGLKILTGGLDPYIYQAAANTGKTYEEIEDPSKDRDLGKAQTLGCQFGMAGQKFQKAAWDIHRLKLSLKQSIEAVASYRKTNPTVPELWKAYESAAIAAVETPETYFKAGKCHFYTEDNFLWVRLPSGRRLAYRDPQISWRVREYEKLTETEKADGSVVVTSEICYTKPMRTLEFWAVNSKTKKWALERTWGGTLCENIVQGTARDLMMPGLLRLEKAGYRALFAVHDEGVCERKKGEGNLKEFIRILCEVPRWAPGLPIEAKGFQAPRYRK